MPTVDFTAWVTPNLDVTLGGHAYSSPPRSVAEMKVILAFAALSEHALGIAKGEPDRELVELVESQTEPLAALTLGRPIYDQMISDGIDLDTVQRVGYYAMHYWARGKARADWLAGLMWAPEPVEVVARAPKARRRTRNGPPTA